MLPPPDASLPPCVVSHWKAPDRGQRQDRKGPRGPIPVEVSRSYRAPRQVPCGLTRIFACSVLGLAPPPLSFHPPSPTLARLDLASVCSPVRPPPLLECPPSAARAVPKPCACLLPRRAKGSSTAKLVVDRLFAAPRLLTFGLRPVACSWRRARQPPRFRSLTPELGPDQVPSRQSRFSSAVSLRSCSIHITHRISACPGADAPADAPAGK
ncbi:hypothetical protein ACCO45_003210 [Purpureocillium lilacinum]|uniref:Uncharacterized protein n=1 Tax=Purpureocillium lilacinum TaxID=33203 RepID=A0ACC4DZC4_PURLI